MILLFILLLIILGFFLFGYLEGEMPVNICASFAFLFGCLSAFTVLIISIVADTAESHHTKETITKEYSFLDNGAIGILNGKLLVKDERGNIVEISDYEISDLVKVPTMGTVVTTPKPVWYAFTFRPRKFSHWLIPSNVKFESVK